MFKSGSGFPIPFSAAFAGFIAITVLLTACETPARRPPEPSGPIPWTAAIGRLDAEGDSTSCTATLVEPDVIVTAAHCLFPKGRKLSPAELTFTPNVGAQRLPTVRVLEIVGLGVEKMDPENPESSPTEVDWAILRLTRPVIDVPPIPVEAIGLAEIERRIQNGDVLSNLGYGTYGITISRRLHRSEGCTLIPDWRELTEGTNDELVITTCPVIKGDSGGPILLTDKAEKRRLIAVVSGFWRRPEPPGSVSLAVGARAFAQKLQ
ncbi:trypsin-like serine peptidase [Dongia deserti]|uniref:trypsin-like serine peptidase n=1 Tax=Dongia deserti TaxID=2268030 RepID=UPI000E659A5B|nr:trypsin-like serine protease [Dongia deserti]